MRCLSFQANMQANPRFLVCFVRGVYHELLKVSDIDSPAESMVNLFDMFLGEGPHEMWGSKTGFFLIPPVGNP